MPIPSLRVLPGLLLLAACTPDTVPQHAPPHLRPLAEAQEPAAFGSAELERLAARAELVQMLHRRHDTLDVVSSGTLTYAPLGEAVWAGRLLRQYPGLLRLQRQVEAAPQGDAGTRYPSYTLRGPGLYLKLARVPLPKQAELPDAEWRPAAGDTVQLVAARLRSPRLVLAPGIRVGMSRATFFTRLLGTAEAPALQGIRVVRNGDPPGEQIDETFTFAADTLQEIVLRAPYPAVPPGL